MNPLISYRFEDPTAYRTIVNLTRPQTFIYVPKAVHNSSMRFNDKDAKLSRALEASWNDYLIQYKRALEHYPVPQQKQFPFLHYFLQDNAKRYFTSSVISTASAFDSNNEMVKNLFNSSRNRRKSKSFPLIFVSNHSNLALHPELLLWRNYKQKYRNLHHKFRLIAVRRESK